MSIGYVNGEFVSLEELVIPIDERGHQFGDGIYEVIRVYDGNPFMMAEHVERLMSSGKAIKLQLEDSQYYTKLIEEAVKKSGLSNCNVYLQITRGIAARQHLFPNVPVSITMTVRPAHPIERKVREKGVTAIFHEDERWVNCYIKSLNLLPNILAKQVAHEAGCFEAILVKDDFITEGTSSNVYIVKNSVVQTAPLSKGILPGITRMAVKELCQNNDIKFIEKSFSKEELLQADEVFITSTTSEILSVVEVDGVKISGGTPGLLTNTLYENFHKEIAQLVRV